MPTIQRHYQLNSCFVACKQYSTTEHSSTQSHRRAFPEASHAVVQDNALHSFGGTCADSALTSRFDDVKRLGCKSSYHSSNRSICEIYCSGLLNISLLLEV